MAKHSVAILPPSPVILLTQSDRPDELKITAIWRAVYTVLINLYPHLPE